MAAVLNVPVVTLIPSDAPRVGGGADTGEICLHARTLALFPGLAPYLEMLNKAVTLDDEELIDHITYKIEQLFRKRVSASPVAARALAPGHS